jgi:hypothetical protein
MNNLNNILEKGNINELLILRLSVEDDNNTDILIIDKVNNIKPELIQNYDTIIEFAINYNKQDIIKKLVSIDYPFSESEKSVINGLKYEPIPKPKYGFRDDYFDVLMSIHH